MSTRQKRGGQKNSDPVTKAARVERPIQGPEVHEAQVNSSPNSLPNLEVDSESESEDEDIGLVDDEDDEDDEEEEEEEEEEDEEDEEDKAER